MSRPLILIYDRGSSLSFAQALVEDADVLYYSTLQELAPQSKSGMVARDVPGIERTDSFWNSLRDADVIAFPDVGEGDLQHYLRSEGYKVWGSDKAESLELFRWEFLQLLKKLDLPVPPTRRVIGLDALKSILRAENDLYLKTSLWRGDFETKHHVTWDLTETWFRELQYRLGPHGREIEILVQEPVPGKEIGYEGFTILGQFPRHCAYGLEKKDASYLGCATLSDQLPICLREANEALAEPLRVLGAQGNYHCEVRMGEDEDFITDPCLRIGQPPFAALSLWVRNWSDIVVAGAHGEIEEPDFIAPYAAEIELSSEALAKEWLAIEAPAAALESVRFRRACIVDGRTWCIPHEYLPLAGAAVGLGDTPEAAIDAALAIAEQIEATDLTYDHHVKVELLEEWEEANGAAMARAA